MESSGTPISKRTPSTSSPRKPCSLRRRSSAEVSWNSPRSRTLFWMALDCAGSVPSIGAAVAPGTPPGTATVAAMRWAIEHGYRHMLNMAADFSHHPRYLPAMVAGMEPERGEPVEVEIETGQRAHHIGITLVLGVLSSGMGNTELVCHIEVLVQRGYTGIC